MKHAVFVVALFLFWALYFPPCVTAQCVPDETTLCLEEDRFEVTLTWSDFAGNPFSLNASGPGEPPAGEGRAVELFPDTGYFWFDDPQGTQDVEVMVRILRGCPLNDRLWVFFTGVTNMEYELRVRDTLTNVIRVYLNPACNFTSALDTGAFDTCGATTVLESESESADLSVSAEDARLETAQADVLHLLGGRFDVEVFWDTHTGFSGKGTAVPLTDGSGYFWYFHPQDAELVVKIVDGRGVNGNFWFFYGSLSNVEQRIRITDTLTGETREYLHPLGTSAAAVGDNGDPDPDGDGLIGVCDICPLDLDNDLDRDGVCGDEDNCPSHHNPGQEDADGDGIGDACDIDVPVFSGAGAALLAFLLAVPAVRAVRRNRR